MSPSRRRRLRFTNAHAYEKIDLTMIGETVFEYDNDVVHTHTYTHTRMHALTHTHIQNAMRKTKMGIE